MQTSVQNYYDQRIFTFTFEGITADTNDKGKVVKKCLGMPNWKQINRNNFTNYTFNHHRGLAVLTGRISNITCIDFDIREEYDKLIGDHPELKNYYTVQTNKGYHIYCKYNEEVKTTTNAMNSYNGVDIRNDDGILYAPPTKYKIKNTGAIVEYKYIGGEILEFPDYIFDDLKQNNREIEAQPVPPPPPPRTTTPTAEPEALTDDQIKNNKTKDLDKFKLISKCYNKERISNYDSYFKLTMAIKNCFGDSGKEIWDEICSQGDNYDRNKNNEQWYKYTAKTKEEKLLKFGSLVKWAKEDNPTK